MQMEHAESGMDVVEKALRKGRLPWVATGGTYEHGGTFNRVRVFNFGEQRVFDKSRKDESLFWANAIPYIEERQNNLTQRALEKVRTTLGFVPENIIQSMMRCYISYNQNKP